MDDIDETDGPDGPLGFGPDDGERHGPPPHKRTRHDGTPTIAERLAAADAREAEKQDRKDERRSSGRGGGVGGPSGYGWFVGVVLVLVIAVVTISSLDGESVSSTGLEPGDPAPPFAAPIAVSDLDGDVNVATRRDQGEAGEVPACAVRGPDVYNLCDEYAEGPVVLAFFATRGGPCVRSLDRLEAVRRRHPDIRFAAVSIRGDRDDLRDLVRGRTWGFPVAYDRDGVLANLYGVAVCPQYALIAEGGRNVDTILGEASEAELDRRFSDLSSGRAERALPPPSRTDTVEP